MLRKLVLAFTLLLGCGAASLSGEKIPANAWQKGKLDAITSEQGRQGAVLAGNVLVDVSRTLTHYTIHGEQFIYHADRETTRRDKPLDVTIHGAVEFAVIDAVVYLKDEQGGVHKLTLVSKELPQ